MARAHAPAQQHATAETPPPPRRQHPHSTLTSPRPTPSPLAWKGLSSPMAICTRRRWPSDTRCMRHVGSMSRTSTSRALRAGSTPGRLDSICDAGMSPCARQRRAAEGLAVSAPAGGGWPGRRPWLVRRRAPRPPRAANGGTSTAAAAGSPAQPSPALTRQAGRQQKRTGQGRAGPGRAGPHRQGDAVPRKRDVPLPVPAHVRQRSARHQLHRVEGGLA